MRGALAVTSVIFLFFVLLAGASNPGYKETPQESRQEGIGVALVLAILSHAYKPKEDKE